MAKSGDPTSGWKSYEVYLRDGEGNPISTPVSDAIAASGKLAKAALTKMRLLEELGWPEAKRALKDAHGHLLIVKKDEVIWLLKCKPSCWRIYFYVQESKTIKGIIHVHAICKQTNKEDPQDTRYARSIADGIRNPGGSAVTPFEFPVN